jgi:hypothetical protein
VKEGAGSAALRRQVRQCRVQGFNVARAEQRLDDNRQGRWPDFGEVAFLSFAQREGQCFVRGGGERRL